MVGMNRNHQRLCPSPEWAAQLQENVLPRLCGTVELGDRLLEIGPGPGAATDWLRHRVGSLTAIEIDPEAADKLRNGSPGPTSTRSPATPPGCRGRMAFDTVASFTMLHHVPTQRGQNTILGEALRVLRPGGVLVASDSLPGTALHDFHADDTFNPIDPAGLIARLQTIGYGRLVVEVGDRWTAQAFKPTDE
jgi:SAM-dependent methyltransferase